MTINTEQQGGKADAERELVLDQCRKADATWESGQGKNLVLFFDGTGNILGNQSDTNVVKLMRRVAKGARCSAAHPQVVYYDPGVGTADDLPPSGQLAGMRLLFRRLKGLAAGQGAFENVAQGYRFLCEHYEHGDRIWLFGFSRGAFTARAVGGMVNMYGLVHATGFALIDSMVRNYFSAGDRVHAERKQSFSQDVIDQFSLGRTPLIHFSGMWDTVESIGIVGGVHITNSTSLAGKRFAHVRHAMSIHESRKRYMPRPYADPGLTTEERPHRSFAQVWFRGVHSDIGGSYAEQGLSNITLNWMIGEAHAQGLELETSPAPEDAVQPMHDQMLQQELWTLAGVETRTRPALAVIHPTADPVESASPAQPRATGIWKKMVVSAITIGACAVLFTIASGTRHACVPPPNAAWLAWVPTPHQLFAPILPALGLSCNSEEVGATLKLDFLFIALYFWPVLLALRWAVRRLAARSILHNTPMPTWITRVHLALILLPLMDLAENLSTLPLLHDEQMVVGWTSYLVTPLTVAKSLCIAWIGSVVAFALKPLPRKRWQANTVMPDVKSRG